MNKLRVIGLILREAHGLIICILFLQVKCSRSGEKQKAVKESLKEVKVHMYMCIFIYIYIYI